MNKEQLQEMVELREKVAALRKALEDIRWHWLHGNPVTIDDVIMNRIPETLEATK